jgi:hypothetical protein
MPVVPQVGWGLSACSWRWVPSGLRSGSCGCGEASRRGVAEGPTGDDARVHDEILQQQPNNSAARSDRASPRFPICRTMTTVPRKNSPATHPDMSADDHAKIHFRDCADLRSSRRFRCWATKENDFKIGMRRPVPACPAGLPCRPALPACPAGLPCRPALPACPAGLPCPALIVGRGGISRDRRCCVCHRNEAHNDNEHRSSMSCDGL